MTASRSTSNSGGYVSEINIQSWTSYNLLSFADGFIIISCTEPVTHRQTGQLVIDYITSSIISIKADLIGVPYISPDSRYVITINHRHDSVLMSVQLVTINGLVFAFDVETTLNISDIRFVKSSTSLDYDVYATTDKAEILFLSLESGKVETITGVGEPGIITWFNGGRKIQESGAICQFIMEGNYELGRSVRITLSNFVDRELLTRRNFFVFFSI